MHYLFVVPALFGGPCTAWVLRLLCHVMPSDSQRFEDTVVFQALAVELDRLSERFWFLLVKIFNQGLETLGCKRK